MSGLSVEERAARRIAQRKRHKEANRAKAVAQQRAYRAKYREACLAGRRLAAQASREIAAARSEATTKAKRRAVAATIEPMAIYERALAILPRSIPHDARQSYAAAAFVAVMDGDIPAKFSLADLKPYRTEDLPMDASPRFVFLGGTTPDGRDLLAGLR